MANHISKGTVLSLLTLILFVCVPHAYAKNGTHRVSRMISDTRPWHDCQSEEYAHSGIVMPCDGTTDGSAQLQNCIDAAGLVEGIAYIGECDLKLDSTVYLNNPVTLMGCGSGIHWNSDTDEACTRIIADDNMTDPVFVIKGYDDGTTQKGTVARNLVAVEGVAIQGIAIMPETQYGASVGILIDGSYSHNAACDEPGGCPAGCIPGTDCDCTNNGTGGDPACSGYVRNVFVKDVSIFGMGHQGVLVQGNVFDYRLEHFSAVQNGDTGIETVRAGADTCDSGSCVPKQGECVDCVLISCGRGLADCADDTWSAYVNGMYFDGGHIQGDFGVHLEFDSTIVGTHIEQSSGHPTTGSIGVQLGNRTNTLITNAITAFDKCLVLGKDGSSEQCNDFFVSLGNLTDCEVAITIEDGGIRNGVLHVGAFLSNTSDIDNQITSTALAGEVVYSLSGKGFLQSASGVLNGSQDAWFIKDDDIRLGLNKTDTIELSFNTTLVPNNEPKFRWDGTDERFEFDDNNGRTTGSEMAMGDGTAADQIFSFVSDADKDFLWDDSEDEFALTDGLQLGGHLLYASCSNTEAAATITVDECNVVTMVDNGSTNVATINPCDASNVGRVLHIKCGTMDDNFTDGSNLSLAGNFTCNTGSADDTLTLLCDGTNWIELARSFN